MKHYTTLKFKEKYIKREGAFVAPDHCEDYIASDIPVLMHEDINVVLFRKENSQYNWDEIEIVKIKLEEYHTKQDWYSKKKMIELVEKLVNTPGLYSNKKGYYQKRIKKLMTTK